MYIAGEDALDQFFCRHPASSSTAPWRPRSSTPTVPRSSPSTCCAPPTRRPLTDTDDEILGPSWREYATELTEQGFLRERATGYVPQRADDYPAARTALRSASADSFALIDRQLGRTVRDGRLGRAYSTVHEAPSICTWGAPTRCWSLDLAGRRALLDPFDGDYFAQAKREIMTYITRMPKPARDVSG